MSVSVKTMPDRERRVRGLVFRNATANYSGRIWAALLNVATIPLYVRLMGPEAYGLIGLFALVQGLVQVFDAGLSATLNRELARIPAGNETQRERSDMTRSLEVLYWAFGGAIAAVACCVSPFIATRWLNTSHMPSATISHALMLMGLVVGVSWPSGLYSGGMLGLERHVLLNRSEERR